MNRLLAASITIVIGVIVSSYVIGAALAATASVSVQDNAYVGAVSGNNTTTITVGDTVLWTWTGSNPHTVTSTGAESFDSVSPQTSGTFSHVFNAIGSFTYICSVHGAAMGGTIVVQAGAAPTNTAAPATSTAVPATNTPSPGASATAVPASPTTAAGQPTQPVATVGAAPAVAVDPTASAGAAPTASLPVAGSGGDDSAWGTTWILSGLVTVLTLGAGALLVLRGAVRAR